MTTSYVCENGVCRIASCPLPKFRIPTSNKKQCINFPICNNEEQISYLDSHDGMCLDCNSLYGKWRQNESNADDGSNLKFIDHLDTCPLCLRNNLKCVKRPSCSHFLCIQCFRQVYFGYNFDKPIFPLIGHDENEHLYNIENDIHESWMDDESVKEYMKALQTWIDYNAKLWEKESTSNLKICFECHHHDI